MTEVRIQKINSKRTPWEVFQGVYAFCPNSFFLDSLAYRPPAQRYSYMGWNPCAQVRVLGRKLKVFEKNRQWTAPAKNLWPVLRRLMRQYKPKRSSTAPFFTGGAVGFWGYELAGLFEPVQFIKKQHWGQVPDLHLGFYRNVLVYDHKDGCYYFAAQDKTGTALTEARMFLGVGGNILTPQQQSGAKEKQFRFSRFRGAF